MRDLPHISVFAQEIARLVGGVAYPLDQGQYPSAAINVAGQHLLLLRDHGWTLALSLPTEPQWSLTTWADWSALCGPIEAAVSSYRTQHPQLVSMADVMLALGPILFELTGQPLGASFPGTPDPREGWLRAGSCTVGVFQEDTMVRVVVWILGEMHARSIGTANDFASLLQWARPTLTHQLQRGADAPIPESSKEPPPSLEAVLSKLRAGARIQDGAGRYYCTYFMTQARLRRRVFDEGYELDEDIDLATLQAAIARSPDDFR